MYYGDFQINKTLRPFHKFYSWDGSMEIKRDIANSSVEFITYIGGDGYSAPVIYKSTVITLHDYQKKEIVQIHFLSYC